MAKAKTPATVDTTAGTKAYQLATQYKAELDPRLPTGTVANLAADLTTLGADPLPTPPPAQTPPATPPSLAEAMATATSLVSAVHEAIRSTSPKSDVRKAYGASGKTPSKEAAALTAAGEKILTQAQANPSQALSLGILPADVAALTQALADLATAEALAKGNSGSPTSKDRRAAETRMHEAVTRISGAGVLAFAINAPIRADFAALKPMKGI